MIFGNRDRRQMPQLNTASLPDLIFTVLFFFMVVTHMRTVTLKVSFRVPQGTELTRLTKKTAVSYIYIGRRRQRLVMTRLHRHGAKQRQRAVIMDFRCR